MSDESRFESCLTCPKYIYKGDDEQYCQAARMRPMYLRRWEKKPKWCPIDKVRRRAENNGSSEQ